MVVGIIGGGQLGMMMAQSAIALGHEVISFDPSDNCPITKYSSRHFCAQFNNEEVLREMCEFCDVITYEFENIPFLVIKNLSDDYKIFPNYKALMYSQNRILEKKVALELDIDTANYIVVKDKLHLKNSLFKKSVLKTCSDGYDGKGQLVITDSIKDADRLLTTQCILEEFVEFDCEISVVVNRDVFGNVKAFPIAKNTHRNNILFKSEVPANISDMVEKRAINNSIKLASHLDIVGTLAVEFFVVGDQLLFNEMAPRPHNSGHYTIEACNVSQFDQHIKAVCSKDISTPVLLSDCVMYNILGDDLDVVDKLSTGYIHMYGKTEARSKRKMGHVTFLKNIDIDNYFGGYNND